MTPKFPRWILCLVMTLAAAGSAWAATASPVVSLGDNTFSITVKADNKFTRNTAKLRDEAVAAAKEFCTKAGKHLKVVSITEAKSLPLVGPFAQATLTFKALGSDDPELAAPADAAGKPAEPAPLTTDELYASLLKLDDLHKKGILTDEEFAAEKKKLLARSK